MKILKAALLLGFTLVGGNYLYKKDREHYLLYRTEKIRYEKFLSDVKELQQNPMYGGELDGIREGYERSIALMDEGVKAFERRWSWYLKN